MFCRVSHSQSLIISPYSDYQRPAAVGLDTLFHARLILLL